MQTNTTRRAVLLGAPIAVFAFGQELKQENGEWKSEEMKGTFLRFDNEPDKPDDFSVLVRTSVKADLVRVQVFYEVRPPEFAGRALLISRQSIATVAGPEAYGATDENFRIPRASIRFVRLTMLNAAASRDFTPPLP